MKTRILNYKQLEEAADLIRSGNLVVFPTETVYGLGANALNPSAVKKIFLAKGRPMDNPLILHISKKRQINEFAKISSLNQEKISQLVKAFWPGPLTIILPKKENVPREVTAGLDTVAIRMPQNRIARRLISYSGLPIVAPSANISGRVSGTCFQDVLEDLDGLVSAIIKSNKCKIGIESTVLDLTSRKPMILRPGGISHEELSVFLPDLSVYKGKASKAKSPGMKYRHYSPRAKVILFEKNSLKKLAEYSARLKKEGYRVKIIYPEKINDFSAKLFQILRESDRQGFDYILIVAVEEKGMGLAIMDRLKKASSEIISS